MTDFRATVVGSYPRNVAVDDTMKKPSISDAEALDLIRWAVQDQVSLGLEIVSDGEGYRENMYWFYQKRMDGVTMEDMQYKSFGDAGFGIECARLVGELGETRLAARPQMAGRARDRAARRPGEADGDRPSHANPLHRQ